VQVSAWEVVAAIGAGAGGIGSAVSAFFAWRSASASERTSRDARDALSHAIQPDPLIEIVQVPRDRGGPPGQGTALTVRVVNMDRWTANDLELQVTLADGEVITSKRARLEPFAPHGEDDWWARVRDVSEQWPPKDHAERIEVVLRYSDAQSTARHETTLVANARVVGNNLTVRVEAEPVHRRPLRPNTKTTSAWRG
jgi:hypothetical protein